MRETKSTTHFNQLDGDQQVKVNYLQVEDFNRNRKKKSLVVDG